MTSDHAIQRSVLRGQRCLGHSEKRKLKLRRLGCVQRGGRTGEKAISTCRQPAGRVRLSLILAASHSISAAGGSRSQIACPSTWLLSGIWRRESRSVPTQSPGSARSAALPAIKSCHSLSSFSVPGSRSPPVILTVMLKGGRIVPIVQTCKPRPREGE